MEGNRGVALILALLALSFLAILGGALLTNSTIDVWISDNYKSSIQSLYLAEAGIDDARQWLRISGRTSAELLAACAGPDGLLMTADDAALIPARMLPGVGGTYEVWLHNDSMDGAASVADSNDVLTLVSTAQVGKVQKTIEATVEKGRFPESAMDSRLNSVAGLEDLAGKIARNATDAPAGGALAGAGAAGDYRIVVVNGNLDLGPGAGYGILLVRGQLNVVGDVAWNGLVLVIGQGVLQVQSGVATDFRGGVFTAQTRADDGSPLGSPQNVSYAINDVAQIRAANARFPFDPIAVRER